MPSAGQQLLQLRSRLGGGRKNSGGGGGHNHHNADRAADSPNAAEVSSCAAAAASSSDAAGAGAIHEPRAASPRKAGSPIISSISPSLDLSAVFKPSQSLASRRKVGRPRRHKSGKKGGSGGKSSSSSKKGDGEHRSQTKKSSGRRLRPGGKEGRRSRRNKREQESQERAMAAGAEGQQQQPDGSASGEASDSVGTATAASERNHAIFVTKTAGGEAVEAAFLPPPIGLNRHRTYSHSDHDTLLTGSGTLTTAVSTRQATLEGMSHQDTLEPFDVQTNQSSEIASLGGGSAGYGRVGFAKLEELPSVVAGADGGGTDAIVADGKTPTLSIHTFPCARGRSLEAPAPFDERGADAMTRYRQHDEDEYLTDESGSEVPPVVPLHWPKARRPGEERDFEGLVAVSADADLFDDDDSDDDEIQIKVEALPTKRGDSAIEEEEDKYTDGDLPATDETKEKASTSIAIATEGVGAATTPAAPDIARNNNKRDHQCHQHDEEVTGEEIEVEVQESAIGITATAPAASSTSNAKVVVEELSLPTTIDTERSPTPTSSVAAVNITKVTTQASMSDASENKRPPRSARTEPPKASSASSSSDTICRTSSVASPFGRSISRAAAGQKTPTDHAFSSAIVTPERRRMEPKICELDEVTTGAVGEEPNDDDDHSTASDRECNSSVEVLKGDDDVEEEEERADGEEKKEEPSVVIAKVPSNDDSESTPSGLVPFSPPLPTRASSFPNLQAARTASFSAIPSLPNPIPLVRQAESFGARSNMSIGSNSSSAWKSWPAPADPIVSAAQSGPASSSSVQIPSSVLAGNDSEDESDRKDNLPPPPACSTKNSCEKESDDGAVKEKAQSIASDIEGDSDDNEDYGDDDGVLEGAAQKLRASPDGSASTVRIRTFDASRPPNMVEEVTAIEPKSSSGVDEDVPPIPFVASISFPTNRYLNPKLDDGKLYSEHPHDEAPSPLQSPKDDIFRSSGDRGAEDGGEENGRSEFPKIAHSSSSGSHSLPAVLSPAYKFEPIENDYYYVASESESCSGEDDESNYESSPDCLNPSKDKSGEGANEQVEVDDWKPSPNIDQNKVDDSQQDDVQSSRYESFARSGVNLMRNLTQHDDSTASSIVAEAAAAATAAVSGRQQPSERSSKDGAKKKTDEFTFSISDIPSMLSRCIGDIGIGEYYDANASAFQPEKEIEKKK